VRAVLGPVDLTPHGAEVRKIDTLVQDGAGSGGISFDGTDVADLIFGRPGACRARCSAVPWPGAAGLATPASAHIIEASQDPIRRGGLV
jgi:hypothetical protein